MIQMDGFVAVLIRAFSRKRKRGQLYISVLSITFLAGFLYYAAVPVLVDYARLERELKVNNIAFVMQLKVAKNGHLFVYRFKHCIASICKHSSIGLTVHIFANSFGKSESSKILEVLAANCVNGLNVKFYDVDEVLENVLPSINVIKDATEVGGRNNTIEALFYLPIFMNLILPEDVTRVIFLDVDFFFYTDIKELFDHFDNFKNTTLFGLALVQEPIYRRDFEKYREEHPVTKMGDPPPNGRTGYSGGLTVINLDNMRRSERYKNILLYNEIKKYAEKYQFQGTRGQEDFFVLLDAEHHEDLFYVVPCQWNRQLYLGLSHEVDFDNYHNCPKPIHAYHGNFMTRMPTMYNFHQFLFD